MDGGRSTHGSMRVSTPTMNAVAPPQHEAEALSLEDIYDAHADYMFRALRHLGVPDSQLDDAVQDVFLVVLRKSREFEGRSSLQTWLYGIALRVARNYRKRRDRQRREHDELPAELVSPHAGPAEQAEVGDALQLVQRLLETLPPEQLEVFALTELEQLSAPQIAEILSLNLNTVYSRLRLARRAFQKALAAHRELEARRAQR